jgi:hypothetical protein
VGKISLMMSAILGNATKGPPEDAVEIVKQLFKLREHIDRAFPIRPDMDEGPCPLCVVEDKNEGDPCTHGKYLRASLMVMAMLRIEPDADLDLMSESDEVAEAT